jgi:hypothetical protein
LAGITGASITRGRPNWIEPEGRIESPGRLGFSDRPGISDSKGFPAWKRGFPGAQGARGLDSANGFSGSFGNKEPRGADGMASNVGAPGDRGAPRLVGNGGRKHSEGGTGNRSQRSGNDAPGPPGLKDKHGDQGLKSAPGSVGATDKEDESISVQLLIDFDNHDIPTVFAEEDSDDSVRLPRQKVQSSNGRTYESSTPIKSSRGYAKKARYRTNNRKTKFGKPVTLLTLTEEDDPVLIKWKKIKGKGARSNHDANSKKVLQGADDVPKLFLTMQEADDPVIIPRQKIEREFSKTADHVPQKAVPSKQKKIPNASSKRDKTKAKVMNPDTYLTLGEEDELVIIPHDKALNADHHSTKTDVPDTYLPLREKDDSIIISREKAHAAAGFKT